MWFGHQFFLMKEKGGSSKNALLVCVINVQTDDAKLHLLHKMLHEMSTSWARKKKTFVSAILTKANQKFELF